MKITKLQNLMVSLSLNPNNSGDLLKVGFLKVFRTRKEQEALTALYKQKAKTRTPRLDVFRFNRTDAAGNQQADGGYQLFTAEGQKMVTPSKLTADLVSYGFHLAVAEIFQAEGDDSHHKLRLTFSRNSSVKIQLNDRQKKMVNKYFGLVFWKLFGFYNPESAGLAGDQNPIKGSIVTLNFSGVMNFAQVKQNQANLREVRMIDADGHLACSLRDPGAAAIPSAPAVPQRCPERTPARFLKASLDEAFDQGLGTQ